MFIVPIWELLFWNTEVAWDRFKVFGGFYLLFGIILILVIAACLLLNGETGTGKMREIKFRMWLGGGFRYWGFMKGRTDYFFAGIPSTNAEPISTEEAMQRSQQYTGLTDKNGKEVYEGDIVEIREINWPFFTYREIVKWDRFGFWPWTLCSGEIDIDQAFSEKAELMEVIGNIYENPELMEGKWLP